MSKIALSGNPSGTGTFTIASPNSNNDRTVNLPDSAGDLVVTSATQSLTNKSFNSAPVDAVTGTAPLYMCRAWVNFNGTGTVAIRASGNVGSITDLGTGVYRVNFTTAMPDTNYSVNYNTDPNISVVGNDARAVNISNFTTSSFQLNAYNSSSGVTGEDQEYVACSIFR